MNLGNLIRNLNLADISKYNKLFRYQVFLTNYIDLDWKKHLDLGKLDEFQRNLVCREDQFEMFIINWPSYWKSKIHDHANNGCLLKVLDGNLEETIYTPQLEVIQTNYLRKNRVGYLDNTIGLHSVKNIDNSNSVSIHVYSPPRHKTEYF